MKFLFRIRIFLLKHRLPTRLRQVPRFDSGKKLGTNSMLKIRLEKLEKLEKLKSSTNKIELRLHRNGLNLQCCPMVFINSPDSSDWESNFRRVWDRWDRTSSSSPCCPTTSSRTSSWRATRNFTQVGSFLQFKTSNINLFILLFFLI